MEAAPPTQPRPRTRRRRVIGVLLVVVGLLGIGREMFAATDFPTAEPVTRVDAALVAHLRANPGLHLALADDYVLEVALELVDDPQNREVYGTSIDLREPVTHGSIHIQRKGDRGAIHADGNNPRMGWWPALVHGTVDVPVIPLALVGLLGFGLAVAPIRRRR